MRGDDRWLWRRPVLIGRVPLPAQRDRTVADRSERVGTVGVRWWTDSALARVSEG